MFNADLGNAGYRWPVVRLRPGGDAEVTLLSTGFFALTTHFMRVTVVCCVDCCGLCDLLPARGLLYLAVMCNGRRSILELGICSGNDLEQHAKLLHGGMRPGLQFRLSRKTKKGGVLSECTGFLPDCLGVDKLTLAQRVLALYKLPCCNPGEGMEQYETRVRAIVQRRNFHLAAQLEASSRAGS